MSFGQPPVCDSTPTEPGARPSRGEKPPVPPKPARLRAQAQGAAGGSRQPAPFSPHTPPRQEDEYAEYMRSRPPSQGTGAMDYIAPPEVRRPTRPRMLVDPEDGLVTHLVPPMRPRQVYSIDPETRRRIFRPADSGGASPHTPPREDGQYAEYMRSRPPSQGDGEMSFEGPADGPPTRRMPPRHHKGPYTIDPLTRRRNYGTAPSGLFGSDRIHNVTSQNFDQITKSMEKAFVMFYDPTGEGCTCAALEFAKAAEMPHPDNHAFAAVDCTQDRELCAREGATTHPMFKLYSNGFDLSTIKNVNKFCAEQMERMLRTSPVLNEPRVSMVPGAERR